MFSQMEYTRDFKRVRQIECIFQRECNVQGGSEFSSIELDIKELLKITDEEYQTKKREEAFLECERTEEEILARISGQLGDRWPIRVELKGSVTRPAEYAHSGSLQKLSNGLILNVPVQIPLHPKDKRPTRKYTLAIEDNHGQKYIIPMYEKKEDEERVLHDIRLDLDPDKRQRCDQDIYGTMTGLTDLLYAMDAEIKRLRKVLEDRSEYS